MYPDFEVVGPLFSTTNALATISNCVESKFMLGICMVHILAILYIINLHSICLAIMLLWNLKGMQSERGTYKCAWYNLTLLQKESRSKKLQNK